MAPGKFLLMALLPLLSMACGHTGRVVRTEYTGYRMTDSTVTGIDSVLETTIRPYRDQLSRQMNEVISVSDMSLEKGQPESLLGDFFSDACLAIVRKTYTPADQKQADFAFFNNGGLRASLPKGNITRGTVYELMPFDNELVVLELDGEQVKKLLDFIAAKKGVPVSGVRFTIQDMKASEIMIGGMPFDVTKRYKAVTSDYLANGGDQYFFLAEAKKDMLNLRIRDALIDYLQGQMKEGKNISATLDQRIK